jgi:hypothetical protein
MQEVWLPSNTSNSKAVGRFVDHTDTYTNKAGEKCTRDVVLLLTKIPGSNDMSSHLVKDNPDGRKLKAEYSRAWEHYERTRSAPAAAIPTAVEFGLKGTPIEVADFIGKDHIARLKLMGFLTLEQVADMSDAICNTVGFGARNWKRKAAEYLVVAKDQPAAPVEQSPIIAEMMKRLDEANAIMAKQAELIASLMAKPAEPTLADMVMEPHEVPDAPKSRRRKSADAEAA